MRRRSSDPSFHTAWTRSRHAPCPTQPLIGRPRARARKLVKIGARVARSEVEVDLEKSPRAAPEEIIDEIVDRLIVMGRGLRICECGQHGVRMQPWEATP